MSDPSIVYDAEERAAQRPAAPTLQPPERSSVRPPLHFGEHARMAENLHQDLRVKLRGLTIGDAALVLLALQRELADHIEELRQ